jgi:hypothetical protein
MKFCIFSPLFFIAVACNHYEQASPVVSQELPDKPLDSSQVLDAANPADQNEASKKNLFAYVDPILDHLHGKKIDPSIQFIFPEGDSAVCMATPKPGSQGRLMSSIEEENLNNSIIVLFNEIPGTPPFRLEEKRLAQRDPNEYWRAFEQESTLNQVRQDGLKTPFGILMPPEGYLPGERVSWRISSESGEVLKEAMCCPCPLMIKNSSGERLLEAALISVYGPTTYALLFSPRKEPIEYVVTAGVKQVKNELPAGGSKMLVFVPKSEGEDGGLSVIELYSEGQAYRLELPWGEAVLSILGL